MAGSRTCFDSAIGASSPGYGLLSAAYRRWPSADVCCPSFAGVRRRSRIRCVCNVSGVARRACLGFRAWPLRFASATGLEFPESSATFFRCWGLAGVQWGAMSCIELAVALERFGAVQVRAALGAVELAALWARIRPETAPGAVRGRSGGTYGARAMLMARADLETALAELGVTALAARALGSPAFPLDAQFLDKHRDANWAVPAHQDVIVPIAGTAAACAVRNGRSRHGLQYGEPAVVVLQELVALRIHFDDAGAESGGIAIVNGSHARGRLSGTEIREIPREVFEHYDCSAGDVLLMKPLAVHRSGRSLRPRRRRVLHVLYAPRDGWHGRLGQNA